MDPWIKRGLTEFAKLMLLFGAGTVCCALIIAICTNIGINPVWGYVTVFTAAVLAVSLGTEKFKYELEAEIRERLSNNKEKK